MKQGPSPASLPPHPHPPSPRLQLSHNRIKHLFCKVDGWPALEILNLRNNDLRQLPRELGWLKELKQLQVSGNVKLMLPQGVHKSGCRCAAALATASTTAGRTGLAGGCRGAAAARGAQCASSMHG